MSFGVSFSSRCTCRQQLKTLREVRVRKKLPEAHVGDPGAHEDRPTGAQGRPRSFFLSTEVDYMGVLPITGFEAAPAPQDMGGRPPMLFGRSKWAVLRPKKRRRSLNSSDCRDSRVQLLVSLGAGSEAAIRSVRQAAELAKEICSWPDWCAPTSRHCQGRWPFARRWCWW